MSAVERPTDGPDSGWVLPDGWTTTHLIRDGVTPLHTVCGRRVGDRQLLPEIADDRCGQCARRARATATNGASR